MNIYFLSGLGADERVFKKIILPDGYNAIHLKWIENLPNEELNSYCKRFSKLINTEKPFMLAGLSFGGIVALELSRIIKPEKIILLSSIKSRNEMSPMLKLIDFLKIGQLAPEKIYKSVNIFIDWLFGLKEQEARNLFYEIINDSNAKFNKWCAIKVLTWNSKIEFKNITHIHGDADNMFPIKYLKADYIINGGGHFAIHSNAEKVNQALADCLK